MSIEAATRILRKARSALFITGAGLSEESGLPSYRGIGGLSDAAPDGNTIESVLRERMLALRPTVTWERVRHLQEACRGLTWSAAHAALATLEARLDRAWVLTQNVDGLHQKAGSRHVIELHGDLFRARCTACAYEGELTFAPEQPPILTEADLPRCPRCSAQLRPDLLLAGERIPSAKTNALAREVERGFDVVMAIGNTRLEANVSHPILLASVKGVPTIEVNLAETTISDTVSVKLAETAVDALTAIVRGLGD